MGFFSSRKAETSALPDNVNAISVSAVAINDKSVVQLIRSKFYGKGKYTRNSPSISAAADFTHIPKIVKPTGQTHDLLRPSLQHSNATEDIPRPSADAITITLAQRLNELATANAEGLLDDDEYRLLRHSLFERFASTSQIPTEVPVVQAGLGTDRPSLPVPRADNLHVSRAPSMRSQTSLTSTVSGIFRRAPRKATFPKPEPFPRDDVSVLSTSSRTSSTILRSRLQHSVAVQASDVSLKSKGSQSPPDLWSISSRRTGNSAAILGDVNENPAGHPIQTSKGTEPPPSSFTARHLLDRVTHDDNLKTAADIRAEIRDTEAEGRRLLDAFNGLELSTLTRHRTTPSMHINTKSNVHVLSESTWTLIPNGRTSKDYDAFSVRSAGNNARSQNQKNSLRTTFVSHSTSLGRKSSLTSMSSRLRTNAPLVPFSPPSLSQRDSSPLSASASSLGTAQSILPNLTSAGPLLTKHQRLLPDTRRSRDQSSSETDSVLTGPSSSRVDLGNGIAPSYELGNSGIDSLQADMDDIHRRRAEVVARYQRRLEYLSAKLKGAEIHERLLRK